LLIRGSRYAEIRDLYVGQLAHAWVTDSTEATRTNVEKKIDSFGEGDLEHATEMLASLWKIANKDGNVAAPQNAIPAVSPLFPRAAQGFLTLGNQPVQVKSPAHWTCVKIALIQSIRTGVFFDRKYWARHLKTGDVLKPIYFSNMIMSDKATQLNKCKSGFAGEYPESLSVVSGQIPQGPK
jgi:hypothetical protein